MAEHATHRTVEATLRPVPRYGVFMGVGVVLGIIVAAILTAVGSYDESVATEVVYPPGQVFGFALLWTVPIGLAVGGMAAVVLDRMATRRAQVVRFERETVERQEDARQDDAQGPEA